MNDSDRSPRDAAAVAVVDALASRGEDEFASLRQHQVAALRVHNLVAPAACSDLAKHLSRSPELIEHSDVSGLRVLGLSHFQAARDTNLRQRYSAESRSSPARLRQAAAPHASPFDIAMAFLAQAWPAGCQIMDLPTEGKLAAFTIRHYAEGVGIEPHQDVLSAESPRDPKALGLLEQFAANIYLSVGLGGELEIFDASASATGYKDLSAGPQVVPRSRLPSPLISLRPTVGELILFPSRRVHAVLPVHSPEPRITVSFFVGIEREDLPLAIWA